MKCLIVFLTSSYFIINKDLYSTLYYLIFDRFANNMKQNQYFTKNMNKNQQSQRVQWSTQNSPQISSLQKHTYYNKAQSNILTQPGTLLHSKKQSLTQSQIYSHQLIHSIMKKRNLNSITHQINKFASQTQLYSKPLNPQVYNLMEFSDQRNMYQSEYSKKIIQINGRVNHGLALSSRVGMANNRIMANSANITTKQTKIRPNSAKVRPTSANLRPNSNNQNNLDVKVSVSGLSSYKFNSVKASKHLGYDLEHDQSKLQRILHKLNGKNQCCLSRQQKMVQKGKVRQANVNQQVKNAIFNDLQTQTKGFLDLLTDQVKQDQIVYGVKLTKLICIKQFMQQQKIKYADAQEIINEIQAKKKEIPKKVAPKIEINEQFQLNNRRQVVQKNRVMLKQLYFSD